MASMKIRSFQKIFNRIFAAWLPSLHGWRHLFLAGVDVSGGVYRLSTRQTRFLLRVAPATSIQNASRRRADENTVGALSLRVVRL